MNKYLISAIVLTLVFPVVSAMTLFGNTVDTLNLHEKNPSDWSIVPDGNCNGLDFTNDSVVNQRDESYVLRNKIDVNSDGVFNSLDVTYMREHYQNCRAGVGLVEFSVVNSPWRIVQERVKVSVWNLNPMTEYQLIYYGDETHNDVWPFATCIGEPRVTSTQGYFSTGSMVFNHASMWNDATPQKFWVVLKSDVDCTQGKMIAWDPKSYLFEENVI